MERRSVWVLILSPIVAREERYTGVCLNPCGGSDDKPRRMGQSGRCLLDLVFTRRRDVTDPWPSGSQARLLLSCDELLTDLGAVSRATRVCFSVCVCLRVSVWTSAACDLIYPDKATGPNNKNVYFLSLSRSLPLSLYAPGRMGEVIKQNKPTRGMTSPKSNFWIVNPLFVCHTDEYYVRNGVMPFGSGCCSVVTPRDSRAEWMLLKCLHFWIDSRLLLQDLYNF